MVTANIIYDGGEFDIVRRFDCHVLDFGYKEGGSFMTEIPISHLHYREEHPTQAKVKVHRGDSSTRFDIFDDRGKKYVVEIANALSDEINAAIESAREQRLLLQEKV